VILLSVSTLGFYYVLWFYSLWREARRFAHGHHGIRIPLAGMATFFHVLVPMACGGLSGTFLFAVSQFGSTSYRAGRLEERHVEMAIAVLTVLLTGALLAATGAFRLPGLIRKMEISTGVDSRLAGHPGTLGFLVFVPYAGWLIWMGMTQSLMNDFWRKQDAGSVP